MTKLTVYNSIFPILPYNISYCCYPIIANPFWQRSVRKLGNYRVKSKFCSRRVSNLVLSGAVCRKLSFSLRILLSTLMCRNQAISERPILPFRVKFWFCGPFKANFSHSNQGNICQSVLWIYFYIFRLLFFADTWP